MVKFPKIDFLDILTLVVFGLYPFGQLIRFKGVHPLEIILLILGILNLFKIRRVNLSSLHPFTGFLLVAIFSLFLSLSFFRFEQILIGLAYLSRLIVIFLFYLYLNRITSDPKKKHHLLRSLLISGVCLVVFGWIQYLVLPDLRFMKIWGWDDHYYRLVSTLFDPAFTAIIIVLAAIISLSLKKHILTIFLLVSLLFTYSRSGYLSFALGSGYFFYHTHQIKKFMVLMLVLVLGIIFLPAPGGEGVNLKRTNSIVQKIEEAKVSVKIFSQNPVFGIGFNNLCIAKVNLGVSRPQNHSCSGTDNSLLFVLTTTGIVGLMIFLHLLIQVHKQTASSTYGLVFKASFVAALSHSFFTNTLFYLWILIWLGVLIAISRKP